MRKVLHHAQRMKSEKQPYRKSLFLSGETFFMSVTIERLSALSRFVRMSQLPFLARRSLGLSALDRDAFQTGIDPSLRRDLAALVGVVRGQAYRPAIFVHGVLPRSGTNFLADAIALHPHTTQNPGGLWEFPLLYTAPGAEALQHEFQFMFMPNRDKMIRHEMLAYLAAGWMVRLQAESGERTMLIKSPHAQCLALFPAIFPRDHLFVLIRDGRDVLQSSLATFGARAMGKSFSAMAHEWAEATRLALSLEGAHGTAREQAMVLRYEDLVRDGRMTMEKVLLHAGLDLALFDWARFDALPLRGSSTNKAAPHEKWQQQPRHKDFNPLGRWRNWSDRRKQRFKAIAGDALIAAGYVDNNDW